MDTLKKLRNFFDYTVIQKAYLALYAFWAVSYFHWAKYIEFHYTSISHEQYYVLSAAFAVVFFALLFRKTTIELVIIVLGLFMGIIYIISGWNGWFGMMLKYHYPMHERIEYIFFILAPIIVRIFYLKQKYENYKYNKILKTMYRTETKRKEIK